MMNNKNIFITTVCAFVLFACHNSKHPLDRVSELKEGYLISTEKGWQLPVDTVAMSNELALKLNSFDEAALNMNEFLFYAQKKLPSGKRIVLWAQNNIADVQPDGVVYLSVTDENLKAFETIDVVNSNESEGGKFFDVFTFDANNRFSKSRMIHRTEGPDVVFRYEYHIRDDGTIELEGQFLNQTVVDEINAEKVRMDETIFEYGLTFLNTSEPFIESRIPERFKVSELMPGYSYELTENGAVSISFVVVNNLVVEIFIYSEDFRTEKDIRVGSTFSQLKNAYDIESVQCLPNDLGIWATIKGNHRIQFQLNLPAHIECNSNDEVPVASVPDEVKITCVRVASM